MVILEGLEMIQQPFCTVWMQEGVRLEQAKRLTTDELDGRVYQNIRHKSSTLRLKLLFEVDERQNRCRVYFKNERTGTCHLLLNWYVTIVPDLCIFIYYFIAICFIYSSEDFPLLLNNAFILLIKIIRIRRYNRFFCNIAWRNISNSFLKFFIN